MTPSLAVFGINNDTLNTVVQLLLLVLVVIWLVNAVRVGVWYPWFIYPMFGWGIGLGSHAWAAYRGDELNEESIRQEMRRIAGS